MPSWAAVLLPWLFARVALRGAEGAPPTVLVGNEAVQHMFNEADKLVKSGQPYNLENLSFGEFHWLLAPAQLEALTTWTRALLNGLDVAPDDVPNSKDDKKKERKTVAKQVVKQSVDSLFD